MTKRNKLLIFAALVLGGALMIWWWTRPDPVAVVLTTVEYGSLEATVANTRAGTIDACRRAGLSPAIGGQIAELPVTEGDRVEAGAILLQLWNDDLAAEVELAERGTTASRALAREACAVAEVARSEAARSQRLREQALTSEEATEKAVGEAKASAAGCEAARDEIRVADARVKAARAALERTILRAPFDGTIAEINGELGEFVTPSPVGIPTPPTIDLIDNSCLYISAPIDEVDAPAVDEGMPARISLDAFPDRTFPGVVRRVAPYVLDIEKQARTVEIEAEFQNPDDANLLPGYSADVEVILATRDNVLRIPTIALLEGERVLVFSEEDQLLRETTVETGVGNWQYTEIVSGLSVGDRVVTSVDREGAVDGAKVEPE